jgi:hypothetical protein
VRIPAVQRDEVPDLHAGHLQDCSTVAPPMCPLALGR